MKTYVYVVFRFIFGIDSRPLMLNVYANIDSAEMDIKKDINRVKKEFKLSDIEIDKSDYTIYKKEVINYKQKGFLVI